MPADGDSRALHMSNETDSAAFTTAWQTLTRSMGVQLPALGPAREHLEMAQKMSDLGQQFQRSYAEFTAHLSGIQQEAMQTLQKPGIGGAYEEWIDSAEAAYATLAHGPIFARLLAELVNTQSAMKVQRGKLLEYFSRQLDLPTRSEVDSLHQQLRLLREQIREPSGIKPSGIKRSDAKPSGIKRSGAKPSGIKRSGAKPSGAKRSGTKRSGSKRSVTKRSGSKQHSAERRGK
jgi:hypothetical protein